MEKESRVESLHTFQKDWFQILNHLFSKQREDFHKPE